MDLRYNFTHNQRDYEASSFIECKVFKCKYGRNDEKLTSISGVIV